MTLRAAELCAGYGGLALAVEQVFGAETRWFSEFEDAPSRILARHWPGIPNHGDMTTIDWAAVEPVDIISGGTPCQDLSHAGRRQGMTDGTRSNLWVQMREAIATIKPTYVIWENVRGAYSARAASASDEEYSQHEAAELARLGNLLGMHWNKYENASTIERAMYHREKFDRFLEQREGLLGKDGRGHLRALGRVLGDLSDLGYDCQWRGLRAADVGAPHGRFRVFVLATHRDHAGRGEQRRAIPVQPEHAATEHAGPHATDTDHERGYGSRQRAEQDRREQPKNRRQPLTDTNSGERDRREREQIRGTEQRTTPTRRSDEPTTDPGCSAIGEHAGESPAEEAGQ